MPLSHHVKGRAAPITEDANDGQDAGGSWQECRRNARPKTRCCNAQLRNCEEPCALHRRCESPCQFKCTASKQERLPRRCPLPTTYHGCPSNTRRLCCSVTKLHQFSAQGQSRASQNFPQVRHHVSWPLRAEGDDCCCCADDAGMITTCTVCVTVGEASTVVC